MSKQLIPKSEPANMEKMIEAWEWRKKKLTYRQIAAEMGLASASMARRLVVKAYEVYRKELAEEVKEVVDRDLEELEEMEKGLLEDSHQGDKDAVNARLKIMDARAKLLGLHKPQKLDLDVKTRYDDLPEDQLLELAKQRGITIPEDVE